jgi:hypothetical protein
MPKRTSTFDDDLLLLQNDQQTGIERSFSIESTSENKQIKAAFVKRRNKSPLYCVVCSAEAHGMKGRDLSVD